MRSERSIPYAVPSQYVKQAMPPRPPQQRRRVFWQRQLHSFVMNFGEFGEGDRLRVRFWLKRRRPFTQSVDGDSHKVWYEVNRRKRCEFALPIA